MGYRFVEEKQTKYKFVNETDQNGDDSFGARIRAEGGTASDIENFVAGIGKGFAGLGRGAAQMVGMGPNAQEMGDINQRDAGLMNTKAGFSGNLAGNILPAAATSIIPGVNTYTGSALVGAGLGALQPTENMGQRATNIGLGSVGGVVGKGIGDKAGQYLASRLSGKAAELTTKQGQKSASDATLKAGQEAGYVLPPSAVKPSFVGNRLESIGGKAAVGQQAAMKNQAVTDKLARQVAGLADDQPLTESTLSAARTAAAEPYRKVAQISPKADDALEAWKVANAEAKAQWKYYNRSAHPDALKEAQAASKAADNALTEIENIARQAKRPDLLIDLKKARVQIAKIHQIEKSINEGTGSVDASVLGRALDRGEKMTGDLRTIGAFQQAFPSYMREASRIPTPGVSKSEALMGLLLGAGGAAATGNPMGAALAALPLLSHPVRSGLLSRGGQAMMTKPQSYNPGLLYSGPNALLNNQATQRLLPSGAALGGIGYFGQQDPFKQPFR